MREYEKLAWILTEYSCALKKGEKVYIEYVKTSEEFIRVLVRQVRKLGAYPFVFEKNPIINKTLISTSDDEWCRLMTKYYLPIMQDMDAYIGIHGAENEFEASDVPAAKNQQYAKLFVGPVQLEERVNNTKWVILNWPTPALAQNAGMSTDAYRKLFFDVCTLDYSKMSEEMDALVELMQRTDRVRIVAPGTDISFSIKGMPAIKCCGRNNIPDGEVFTAPIKDSVNGVIAYNIPTVYNGIKFDAVTLEVQNGKIVKATAGDKTVKLNEILDTDGGARFFGEFALGVNPKITAPMCDILFDEKIAGSIHLTPGDSYEECPNGNSSTVHWDLVLCQLPEFGGGEIYFDGKLIRKDGRFTAKRSNDRNE